MKKLLTILSAFFLLSFTAGEKESKEKTYTVKASLPEWDKHIQKTEAIRQVVERSNLPHQEVVFVTRTIDSLQMLIVGQVNAQLKDTTSR